jgi:hypothetical protein
MAKVLESQAAPLYACNSRRLSLDHPDFTPDKRAQYASHILAISSEGRKETRFC